MPLATSRISTLGYGNSLHGLKVFFTRVANSLSSEGQPPWRHSYNFFLLGSYLNILLVFALLSGISYQYNWDAALQFASSFIAVVTLATVRPGVIALSYVIYALTTS